MGEEVGRVRVRVTRTQPGIRHAEMLSSGEGITFGVPGFQADHYGFPDDGPMRDHAGTYDTITASVGGCLISALGNALSARDVPVGGDRLVAELDGVVEIVDGMMLLRRVEVRYRLVADPAKEPEVMRAHHHHVSACGVARSLEGAIEVTTTLELVPEAAGATA